MKYILFTSVLIALFFSCKSDKNNSGVIPDVYVDLQLNLSNVEYQPLQTTNGYVHINGGARGIIVYRSSSNSFYAFERNCPNSPNAVCAQVSVDSSSLYIQCSCCTS